MTSTYNQWSFKASILVLCIDDRCLISSCHTNGAGILIDKCCYSIVCQHPLKDLCPSYIRRNKRATHKSLLLQVSLININIEQLNRTTTYKLLQASSLFHPSIASRHRLKIPAHPSIVLHCSSSIEHHQ